MEKTVKTKKITESKEFGAALRRRRKELNYTQAGVSEITGFSVSFISDLERGKKTAELEKALYLANMLGVDVFLRARG